MIKGTLGVMVLDEAGTPACPRAGHAGYRVSRDGRYGRVPDARRQRYRCTAPDGSFHRFTPALPREAVPAGTCPECEAHLHVHAGPAAPRSYRHRVQLVADALVAVGRGATYQAASQRARAAAGRELLEGDGTGGLVAEWVDVWAPLVLGSLAGTGPLETVAIGASDVRWTNSRTHERRRQFAVLVAYGYGPDGKGSIRASHVSATTQTLDFIRLLTDLHLSTPPRSIVVPDDPAALAAVRRLWPDDTPDWLPTGPPTDSVNPALAVLPFSTAPQAGRDVADALERLSAALARRSFALRNARRTDLLVGPLRLHLDRRDDPAVYRRILQEYAEANGGVAPIAQRAGHDRYDPAAHRAIPSLRVQR